MAGKILDSDIRSLADVITDGGTAANLPNDTKIYVTANGLNKQLSAAITNGDLGGAGASTINYYTDYKTANGVTNWVGFNETQAVTITIASPAVFTSAATHNFQIGQPLTFSTTGALPTGLTANTTYYVSAVPSGTTYQVSATLGGASVNTSGSQSGTHTQYPAKPVTASGGTVSGLTFASTSSSPIRYTSNLLLTQANSTKVQGQGYYFPITIAAADQAKMIQVSMDYNASTNFTCSNGQTGSDSDLEFYVYDVTNGVFIPLSPKVIVANGANNYTFKGVFQTASNSLSYRLVVYCATPNALSTGFTFKFTNLIFGPQGPNAFGAPVTDAVPFTMVIGGSTTAPTLPTANNQKAYWWRSGDRLEFYWNLSFTSNTGGTNGSGTYLFSLPPGLSIDTTKQTVNSSSITPESSVGTWQNYNGTNLYTGMVVPYNSTQLALYVVGMSNSPTTVQVVGSTGNIMFTDSQANATMRVSVPIAGWSSTTVLSQDTLSRVVTSTASLAANQTGVNPNNSSVKINLNSILSGTKDTVGGFDLVNFKYVAQTAGNYNIGGSIHVLSTNIGNGAEYESRLYKNGSFYATLYGRVVGTGHDLYLTGNFPSLSLTPGDYLELYLFSDANNSSSTLTVVADSSTYLSATLIQGPATVAASETVIAKYSGSGTLSASTSAPWNFSVKEIDTHNAVTTGASWRFTAPTSGNYDVCLNGATSGSVADNFLYKNSSLLFQMCSFVSTGYIGSCGIVKLLAGDFIEVRPAVSASTFSNTNGGNFISIKLVK